MSGSGRRTHASDWMVDALWSFRHDGDGGGLGRIPAQVLIDRSPTMALWRSDLALLVRALQRLRAFRTVRVGDLPSAWSPGGRLSAGPPENQLLILVSDCSSPLWRSPEWWQEVYACLRHSRAALINPLPPKLWRRVGLDLPAVRVEGPRAPDTSNADLDFRRPPLLDALPKGGPDEPSWLPLPVLSLTGHALGQWARTVTGRRSEGCDALLVPGPAPWRPSQPPEPPRTAGSLTDSYLLSASPRAARLAVLCAAYEQLDLAQLEVMSQLFEGDTTTSDLAEVLVSGLFSVSDGGPTLRFHAGVREHLQSSLGVRDVRLLRERLPHYADRLVERRRVARPESHPPASVARPAEERPVEVRPVEAGPAEAPARPSASEHRPSTREAASPYFFLSYAHTPRFGAGDPTRTCGWSGSSATSAVTSWR